MAISLYRARPVPLGIGLLALGLTAGFLPTRAQAGGQRKALVLSVTDANRQSDALRAALGEIVERTGAQLVIPASLSASARGCDDPRCLTALSREHGVDVIIAGRVLHQSKLERLVDVWAFEEGSGRDASERDLCDSRDLPDCLSDLGARVLGKLSAPAARPGSTDRAGTHNPGTWQAGTSAGPSGGNRSGAQVGTTAPRGAPTPLPTWRIGLGTGLAALGAAALGIGIGASVKHHSEGPGQCPQGSEVDCRYIMTPLFAPAYALAAVASVASILTFTLPTRRVVRKEASR